MVSVGEREHWAGRGGRGGDVEDVTTQTVVVPLSGLHSRLHIIQSTLKSAVYGLPSHSITSSVFFISLLCKVWIF